MTIRLTLKPSALKSSKAEASAASARDELLSKHMLDDRIRDLWIPPLETRALWVEVLSPPGFEFDQWELVPARGFKKYW